MQTRRVDLYGDRQVLDEMRQHGQGYLVGDAVGRVAEHPQRFAWTRQVAVDRTRSGFRTQAPDRFGRVGDQLPRRVDHRGLLVRRQAPLDTVALGIVQRRQQQRVVDRRRRLCLDVPLDEVRRFALVAGQQALVVAVLGRQRAACRPSACRRTRGRARACRARRGTPSAAWPAAGRAGPTARSRTRPTRAARPAIRRRRLHRAPSRARDW